MNSEELCRLGRVAEYVEGARQRSEHLSDEKKYENIERRAFESGDRIERNQLGIGQQLGIGIGRGTIRSFLGIVGHE